AIAQGVDARLVGRKGFVEGLIVEVRQILEVDDAGRLDVRQVGDRGIARIHRVERVGKIADRAAVAGRRRLDVVNRAADAVRDAGNTARHAVDDTADAARNVARIAGCVIAGDAANGIAHAADGA